MPTPTDPNALPPTGAGDKPTTVAKADDKPADDKGKEKDDEAKKKQQSTPTSTAGAKTDDKPKNFCN